MDDIEKQVTLSDRFIGRLFAIARQSILAEMASGMAHELSQPLAAITTFSHAGERMLDRPDPLVARALGVFKEMADEAMQAGRNLQAIRRMFEQTRLDSVRCQMADLITEVRPLLCTLADDSKSQLRFDIKDSVPDVCVDRLRIQHVLLALMHNAVDAKSAPADEHSVRFDVSANRYHIETGVTDSGPGIGPGLGDQVFRPFFTTKPQGNGLGLASSRAIVEAHEGKIGYNNLAGGGCRFWFRLPVNPA